MSGLELYARIPGPLGSDAALWEGHLFLEKMKRLGLIERWNGYHSSALFPDEPPLHMYFVKNTFNDDRRRFGLDGIGRHFSSPEKALWASIGEAVERRTLDLFSPESGTFIDATPKELGNSAIDLSTLAGISPEERQKNQSLSFSDKTKFRYMQVYSLTKKKWLWAPLQLVSFRRHNSYEEPLLRSLVSTGAATHHSVDEALLGAILESLERDAFMITWLNQLSPEYLELEKSTNEELQKMLETVKRYHLEVYALRLPTDFEGIHVVLGLLIDRTGVGPAINVGAKAGFDIEDTVKGVITEMLGTRLFVRMRYDNARKEERDLAFTDRSKIGLQERTLYWCDPQKIERINFLLQGKRTPLNIIPREKEKSVKEKVKFLVHSFEKKGLELAYADLSSLPWMKKLGLKTVMVVAPELQPLSLHEVPPHTWGPRLRSVPLHCGFTPRKEVFSEIHPFP